YVTLIPHRRRPSVPLFPYTTLFRSKGTFGSLDLKTNKFRLNIQKYDSLMPEFRAVAHTATDFFMLSAGNPALLYKTGETGSMQLDRKSTRLNSSHVKRSSAVFCLQQ